MVNKMDFKIVTEFPEPPLFAAWLEFLSDANFATHYTTPGFFTDPFIRGGARFAVLAMDGEKIAAVLTAVGAGSKIESGFSVRPQVAFRKNADHAKAMKALHGGLLEHGGGDLQLAKFFSWEAVESAASLGFSAGRSAGESSVVMLDLAKGTDALFKDFSEARQREIKKAMKQNVLVVKDVETDDELQQLYKIHVEWSRLKNIEPDSLADFTFAINDREYRKTLIAVHNGKVVAGTFFRFCAGGVVEYAGNNSLAENQKLKPNPLVGWRAIEWACANNFMYFSMGASHEFLRRFGGEIVSTYSYTLDRTFLRRHENKERLKQLALNTYLTLPSSARDRIKRTFGK